MTGDSDQYLIWQRSSACADGACVEVANSGDEVLVRNSDRPGEIIHFAHASWREFLVGIRQGRFRP
jgi:hypothetical protein